MECSIIQKRESGCDRFQDMVDVASEGALCSVILHLDATDIKLIYYHFLTTRSYNSDGP